MRKILVVIFLLSGFLCLSQVGEYSKSLSDCALELTNQNVTYDPSYFSIGYPNGDVPSDKGVCTDVVIRAYRKIGIDLQKLVNKDMKANINK